MDKDNLKDQKDMEKTLGQEIDMLSESINQQNEALRKIANALSNQPKKNLNANELKTRKETFFQKLIKNIIR